MHGLRELHDFSELLALCQGRNDQTRVAQLVQIIHVRLVAVTVSFAHVVTVNMVSQGVGCDIGGLFAQAHGATQVGVGMAGLHLAIGVFPLGDQGNDGVGGIRLKLGAVRPRQTRHMASVFDGGDLHT